MGNELGWSKNAAKVWIRTKVFDDNKIKKRQHVVKKSNHKQSSLKGIAPILKKLIWQKKISRVSQIKNVQHSQEKKKKIAHSAEKGEI